MADGLIDLAGRRLDRRGDRRAVGANLFGVASATAHPFAFVWQQQQQQQQRRLRRCHGNHLRR